MSRRPSSPRGERRARAGERGRLVRDLERLAQLQPGGSPERPIEVEAPSQVDVMAAALACPLCEGTLRLEEHAAEVIGGERLRVARLVCTSCRTRRARFFRLVQRRLN